ncbi:putative C6 transcription factor [Lipomyces japonicus]|uniref:putative C6 transcription factor n=1 Tax=Lipomyces japonicus TaxID=56871 RepID=UPI0034CE3F78
MGFECTFFKPQKKRGPPGTRVLQIREQQVKDTCHDELASEMPPQSNEANNDFDPSPSASLSNPEIGAQGEISPFEHNHINQFNQGSIGTEYVASMAATTINSGPTAWGDVHDLEYWLPDSFDTPAPLLGFSGNNIYVKPALPPIVDDQLTGDFVSTQAENSLSGHLPNTSLIQDDRQLSNDIWPSYINDLSLIPWIDVYFDRLHPTLPVLNKSNIFTRILMREHRRNSQFGALLLSVCAFALTQPIDISERPTASSRADQARTMMNEATKMRSSSDFGESPTLEAVLTSFFLFGCLFGSNQHNAAYLRLREAVDLALTLGINDPDSYVNLSNEEWGQWIRTYLILSVTERAYALQRCHSISFIGNSSFTMDRIEDLTQRVTCSLVSGIIVHDEKDAVAMIGLTLLMEIFDSIDEEIMGCWNARCGALDLRCEIFSESKALAIHQSFARVSDSSRYRSNEWFDLDFSTINSFSKEPIKLLRSFLSETQAADVLVTQKWMQNRLWHLCLTHNFLQVDSKHPELCFNYAFYLAETTLELCRSLRISAMEAHGIGIIEKLYDIAVSALTTPYRTDDISSDSPSIETLAKKYLNLLQVLRGGIHPYMEKYKKCLSSLSISENDS